MTIRQMCEELSAELTRRWGHIVTPEDVFGMDPNGEMWPIYELYWRLFADRLPTDVTTPNIGDLRYQNGVVQAWTGKQWV